MRLTKSEFMKRLGDRFEFKMSWSFEEEDRGDWGHYVCSDGGIWFKEKDIFPKVFENEYFRVEVHKDKDLIICDKMHPNGDRYYMSFEKCLPLLIEAIEFVKKIQERKNMKYRVKLMMSGTIIDVVEADTEEEAVGKLAEDYPDFNILEEDVEVLE